MRGQRRRQSNSLVAPRDKDIGSVDARNLGLMIICFLPSKNDSKKSVTVAEGQRISNELFVGPVYTGDMAWFPKKRGKCHRFSRAAKAPSIKASKAWRHLYLLFDSSVAMVWVAASRVGPVSR